jgi:predicted metalloprotease with PDZ domain
MKYESMNSIARLLITVALVLITPIAATGAPGYTATYTVTIPQDNHRVAIVEAALQPLDTVFYMFPGADQFPARWATFVSDFELHDVHGDPLELMPAEDGTWHLPSIPDGPISLRYQVDLEHEDHAWSSGIDGAAYARDWGVFYTARSLFVVNGDDRDNVVIDFRLPAGWHITTPWQKEAGSATRFTAASQRSFETSILFAGTHREISLKSGSFEFLLALGGENVIAQEDTFIEMANGVLEYYTNLMGDTPRLASSANNHVPVVVINEAESTDGEALGNNISILLQPGVDPMSEMIARLIFAHEFFHLWNGKSFTPTGIDGEWFKEGFTNYYTLKALRHIGYLTDESCLDVLGGFFYQRYDSDNAVGMHSITEGELKHDHWGLVYVGGMLVAMAQDLQIRTATDNQHSLDDLMRYLFNHFNDDPYSVPDIEQALSELTNTDQTAFFQRHVYGSERIPLSRMLADSGIQAQEANGQWVFKATEASNLSPCYSDR